MCEPELVMRTPAETVSEFMSASIGAWASADATVLTTFFAEAATYHNGPLEPVHGRDAIVAALASMMQLGGEVSVDVTHMVAQGPVVMTERVDYWKSPELKQPATLRIAGVFEVHDGVITAWRDYFDANEFTSQVATEG
jgi:limonene-1,2-epoxide hydrolase